MTSKFVLSILVVLGLGLTSAGCATSRSELSLGAIDSAPAETQAAAPTGKTFYIRTVTDARKFEAAPRDPSIPSLGFGGAEAATAEVRARAIGRKRNTYGAAMGDVLLEEGETVEAAVRDTLTAALRSAGHEVVDEASAGPDAIAVDVDIHQFWEWFTPGFWAITLSGNIETGLTPAGATEPVMVSVHVEKKAQTATDGAWLELLGETLAAYRTEASKTVAGAPF